MCNLLNSFLPRDYLGSLFLFQIKLQGISFKQKLFGLVYFQGTEFQIWICCAMDYFNSSRFDTAEELDSDLEKRPEETTQNSVYREEGVKIWKSTSDAHISTQRQKEKKKWGKRVVLFWPYHKACRVLVSDQGLILCPLQWKLRVLTSEPPGKS